MSWRINSTETDGLVDDQPALTPGESDDFSFLFRSRPGWDDPTDDHLQRFDTARGYAANAGTAISYTTIETDIYWYEQVSNPSPLVKITAPDDDLTAISLWGLIEEVDADTSYPSEQCVLSLGILMITPVGTDDGEFETEADLRAARQTKGP